MSTVPIIQNDERLIKEIVITCGDGDYWSIGCLGVTRIVAYQECSQIGTVTWLAVYKGDWLEARVNAAHVTSLWYGEKVPEGK